MTTVYITLPTSGLQVALQYSATFGEVAITCVLLALLASDVGRMIYQLARDMVASRVSQFVTQQIIERKMEK